MCLTFKRKRGKIGGIGGCVEKENFNYIMITIQFDKDQPSTISIYQQLAMQGFDNYNTIALVKVLTDIIDEVERQEALVAGKFKKQEVLKYQPLI